MSVDERGRPSAEESDEDLARRSLVDREAFGLLYDRYATPVFRFCARRTDVVASAEDAASATFLRALDRLPQFRGGSFAAWLFAIARSASANETRRRRPTEQLDGRAEIEDGGDGPEGQALHGETTLEIRRLLGSLPSDQRAVVELRLAGLKGAEIAEALGRSVAAVKMLQLRAMHRLRQESLETGNGGRW
ncbi:MAG: RNA polymerase sigma factor [Thermomicrobiales bacterium]